MAVGMHLLLARKLLTSHEYLGEPVPVPETSQLRAHCN